MHSRVLVVDEHKRRPPAQQEVAEHAMVDNGQARRAPARKVKVKGKRKRSTGPAAPKTLSKSLEGLPLPLVT